jgi:hypothetical protein
MIVWTDNGSTLDTYRAVAESGALGADRNDSDVPGLLHQLASPHISRSRVREAHHLQPRV